MSLLSRTSANYFVADNATLVGDVTVGEECSFWFNVVVRGDVAPIVIGRRVNVQDATVIHVDSGVPNVIEDDVSIGHRAIVHGKRVGRGALIGMGAIVLSGSVIGEECLIAAGAVVPPNASIPARSVVMGVPGKIVRQVTDKDLAYMRMISGAYLDLAVKHAAGRFPPAMNKPETRSPKE
jgi:carbonic anhydrase/acetyltransferase-like protein (isoleucine patch superfamily)